MSLYNYIISKRGIQNKSSKSAYETLKKYKKDIKILQQNYYCMNVYASAES